MTRIVAGTAGGRRLAVPPGRGTRPTSDRAREGLFSTVTALLGDLHGTRVLDLYAGSGAVGLEALSRGAAHALLVESDARSARTLRANVEATALPGAEVRHAPVQRTLAAAPAEPYGLAFADPPYDLPDDELHAMFTALIAHDWLEPGALVVVERSTRSAGLAWPRGYEPVRERRYGETTLWYGRRDA